MNRKMMNPFGKDFSDLTEDDLSKLMEVNEGWYIEYKKEKIKSSDLAKSISAFSNSYGGLLFFGVDADKKTNKATSFPGVNFEPDFIHDAVRGNVSPFPFFETEIINLNNGNHVILVIIPEGQETPYIHNNGRIYKRQESSSDPIHENNRELLQKLYEKSIKVEERKERFRNNNYGFCSGEDEQPFLSLYINTVPFDQFMFKDCLRNDFLKRLKNHFNEDLYIEEPEIGIIKIICKPNFNSVNRYYDSVMLRNFENINIAYNQLTIEIDNYGNFKALLPLKYHSVSEMYSVNGFYAYLDKLKIESTDIIKFIDIKELIGLLILIIHKYYTFLIENDFSNSLQFQIKYENCYRTSIYSNSNKYLKYVEEYGLPFCLHNDLIYPESSIVKSIASIKEDINKSVLFLVVELMTGFGISHEDVFQIVDWEKESV